MKEKGRRVKVGRVEGEERGRHNVFLQSIFLPSLFSSSAISPLSAFGNPPSTSGILHSEHFWNYSSPHLWNVNFYVAFVKIWTFSLFSWHLISRGREEKARGEGSQRTSNQAMMAHSRIAALAVRQTDICGNVCARLPSLAQNRPETASFCAGREERSRWVSPAAEWSYHYFG